MSIEHKTMRSMAQGLTYNVDIVMCIDCTGSMGDLLDTVKKKCAQILS